MTTTNDVKIKIRYMRIDRSNVLANQQELETILLEIEAGLDAPYDAQTMESLMVRKDLTVSMCNTRLEMLSNQCEPLNRQIRDVLENRK